MNLRRTSLISQKMRIGFSTKRLNFGFAKNLTGKISDAPKNRQELDKMIEQFRAG